MTDLIVRDFLRSSSLKIALFFLTVSAILIPGMSSVRAEIIIGILEKYNSQRKQATINLGKKNGVGKYDRGKIELTSLDSPNVRFIGANIVVISVSENSALVSVREAPGVQIPLQKGARVTLDTGSGLARREEEAALLANQQAERARQQRQLEQARAERARRQRQLEQARAERARQQRQLEQARAERARQQRQLEPKPPEIKHQKIEPEPISTQQKPQVISLKEARDFWRQSSLEDFQSNSVADLPSDYLKAYVAARKDPSPETYYNFAGILIDYEISDKALTWLKETELRFPLTKAVNNFYQTVALTATGDIQKGRNLLGTSSGMPNNQFTDEFKSYLYTNDGEWDKVFSLAKTRNSSITYNNYLIALYCTRPPAPSRKNSSISRDCPFGNRVSVSVRAKQYQDLATLRKISQEAIALYPDNPYILNTLGFLALQSEDYNRAFDYYQQLARLLDKYESTPPRLQLLKANAINYVNNYNQNYEFLSGRSQNLQLLRSQQNSLTGLIALDGAGDIVTNLSNGGSTYGVIAGVLGALARLTESRIQARRIAAERNSILDRMQITFTRDINLVPARPQLEAESILKLFSSKVDKQLILYDKFWHCKCPTTSNSSAPLTGKQTPSDSENNCYQTCRKGDR